MLVSAITFICEGRYRSRDSDSLYSGVLSFYLQSLLLITAPVGESVREILHSAAFTGGVSQVKAKLLAQ